MIGAGGHGRETVSLIRQAESRDPGRWDLLGVVADLEPELDLLAPLGVRWLGPIDALEEMQSTVSVAIGDGRTRARLQRRARGMGRESTTLVHPSASVGWDVEMGQGCYVGALTSLTTHVRLGEGVQVNAGCTLSHDVTVGDFSTLAPGVQLAGGVLVEGGATIYTGAAVLPQVRVGRGAVVGAGAVVTSDVAAGSTVVGVPARAARKR